MTRIDGPSNIDPRNQADSSPAVAKSLIQPAETDGEDAKADFEMISTAQPYVAQAMAGDEVNSEAVARAKQLLQTGQLDTPEAIRRAASAMLDDLGL